MVKSKGEENMIYGYARVSTIKQATKGNSLDDQRNQLKAAGAEKIVTDAYTGTKMDRPNFTQLMEDLLPGDTLIVTKLDRFARTLVEGAQIAQKLTDRGVKINILNMGVIDGSTPTGALQMHILLAFAQYERDMIVERTQAGKAEARAKGKQVDGRPLKYTSYQLEHAMQLLDEGNSYTEVSKVTGISVSTLTRKRRKDRAEE